MDDLRDAVQADAHGKTMKNSLSAADTTAMENGGKSDLSCTVLVSV